MSTPRPLVSRSHRTLRSHRRVRLAWGFALVLLVGLVGLAGLASAQETARKRGKRSRAEETSSKAPAVQFLTPQVSADAAYTRARGKVRVVLYSANWCGVCKQARGYLKRKGIKFVEHDVERSGKAREQQLALSPAGGVPVIQVDELVLRGFSERAFEEALDQAARARLAQPASGGGPKTFEVRWDG